MSVGLKHFAWLAKYTRGFPITGDNVVILQTPSDYFQSIKTAIAEAKHRIVMASLYLGSGALEQEIVDCLQQPVREGRQVTVLLDHLRGSRGLPNSRTMLSKLVSDSGGNFQLFLYHTPNLRGLVKRYFPKRFNEGFGLQHMKLLVFDNDIILTGANLSDQYFINRQDRCMKFFNCPELADYCVDIIKTVCDHSFIVTSDGRTCLPKAVNFDYLNSSSGKWHFISSLKEAMKEVILHQPTPQHHDCDTIVYPLIQMGQYGIRQEEQVMVKMLQEAGDGDHVHLASGYFNLPQIYMDTMVKSSAIYSVLAASPEANGFYGASGVSGHVPSMYIHFAHQFLKEIQRHNRQDMIKYYEFFRKGWTFHGKGLWYYLNGEELPSLTFVGSSNFGKRSLVKDIEAQVAVVTSNHHLRESLHKEREHLFSYATQLQSDDALTDPQRELVLWEWIVTNILKQHV